MKIEGAKLIGSTWHYYKRVPKRLVDAYGLPEFRRGTMGTKDPEVAKRLARKMLSELDEKLAELDAISTRVRAIGILTPEERERLERDIVREMSALSEDQRVLINKAGGPLDALKRLRQLEADRAFLVGTTRAEYELKDEFGQVYDEEEREDEEAREEHDSERLLSKSSRLKSALVSVGVLEAPHDGNLGLSALAEKFCDAKRYIHTKAIKNKTRGQYEYAVRRFVEYHGDKPLRELTRKHLSDFALDFLKLPKSSRKDIRPLAFWDAVKLADREGLPRVGERTRDQNLTLLKSLMAFAKNEGQIDGDDPWAGYMPTVAKQKVSDKRSKQRHVFSVDEVQRIAAHTTKNRNELTIDYWGPLFGAFHGLRLEEVCQVSVADVVSAEGYLCLSVTDEGDFQKVKNENTFRVIPVHQGLVDRGFGGFVDARRSENGNMLFLQAERWTDRLSEVSHDGQGRFGTNYGSRFGRELERLGIVGQKIGFHSYRHAWTDLARNAGIHPEHRRALSGRDSDADEFRVDTTEDKYGHGFSIAVLAESLNRLKPLG